MAQVDSPTTKHYQALALAMKGDAHDAVTHICLDKASMAAFDEDSNAAGSEATESGLARAAATLSLQTTTKANDTLRATKTFTAAAGATCYGALAMSATPAGNCMGWSAWAASQAIAIGDQVVQTFNWQYKKD
jgi:hypothetical protein